MQAVYKSRLDLTVRKSCPTELKFQREIQRLSKEPFTLLLFRDVLNIVQHPSLEPLFSFRAV